MPTMSHGHSTTPHGTDGPAFDPTDPHGATHHEHVIVRPSTLMAVLMTLLFFTLLTVGLSRAEVWAADYFDVMIPQWVNVAVAMSIATVKGLLVLLFFMQLKYDNKLNSIIFANCIFAVGLFLFFSMIDLGNRGLVYTWKQGEISVGGLGGVSRGAGDHKETISGGVVNFAREKYLAEWGPEKFEKIRASVKHEHAHHADRSTANESRVVKGQTGALSATEPSHDAHGGDHDADHDAGHSPDAGHAVPEAKPAEPGHAPEPAPASGGH
jgi:cytochrome c oxidase subunit 4